ncbi:Protein FAM181B [Tupaia chinensis]|uniref:Protein FAM181B n=1 Tax=Tupaia chinensis TaxID=246437 RepID=L9L627_TUPCH|nr:Protein FAM181B [Tupaia chinensis]
MVGNLLYPEPWSVPGCPLTKKPPLTASRSGLTLNEPLRPLYPAAADSPGGEDGPGHLASFVPFFPDCALPPPPPPPHQVSYDYNAPLGLLQPLEVRRGLGRSARGRGGAAGLTERSPSFPVVTATGSAPNPHSPKPKERWKNASRR